MLILTRKSRQSVVVKRHGDVEQLVTVTVLDVSGGRVKLGFEANSDVAIRRTELREISRDNDSNRMPTGPIGDGNAPFA